MNDIWPGNSWSSIEYNGSWKILQYFAKKFYAPLLISCFEDANHLRIYLTSDLLFNLSGKVELTLRDWNGKEIFYEGIDVTLQSQESKEVHTFPFSRIDSLAITKQQCFLELKTTTSATNESKDVHSSSNIHYFTPLKQVKLPKATIKFTIHSTPDINVFKIVLQSDAVAPFVYITTGNILGTLSDNGFQLLPNKWEEVTFRTRSNVSIDQFTAATRITSLCDS